ncbi:hypothetical protein IWW45_006728, partial [Coemansia sp. RSA 485]
MALRNLLLCSAYAPLLATTAAKIQAAACLGVFVHNDAYKRKYVSITAPCRSSKARYSTQSAHQVFEPLTKSRPVFRIRKPIRIIREPSDFYHEIL